MPLVRGGFAGALWGEKSGPFGGMELVIARRSSRGAARPRHWTSSRTTGSAVARPERFIGRLQLGRFRTHRFRVATRIPWEMALGQFLVEFGFNPFRFTGVSFLTAIFWPNRLWLGRWA